MPVLVLAILSIVTFLVTLVLLGLAEWSEARQARDADALADGTPFRVLSVCDAFEQEYAVLWETQAPALRMIAQAGSKGVARQRLFLLYRRSASEFPELYDGTSFRQWLGFLEQAELVRLCDRKVIITPAGLQFLRYRVETRVAA